MFSQSFGSSAILAALFVAVSVLPASVRAQANTAPLHINAATRTSAVMTPGLVATVDSLPSAGPRVSPSGITKPVTAGASGLAQQRDDRANVGLGPNLALMGTGAAGVAIGLVVGGNGGALIAVGGGVLGLVGLYRYLR